MAHRVFIMNQTFRRRKERQYRPRISYLDGFSDIELRARYRFGRESIEFIVNLIKDEIECPTNRNRALTLEMQVLISLRYYVTGNFMQVIGDTFGVEKSTVSRVIRKVSVSLCSKLKQFVGFPRDLTATKTGFFLMAGFPGVFGCVDGTQIRIIGPSENENDFVNRKGFHSLNVQAICDHENRLLNVVARWPGSTHGSRIFRESAIGQSLETEQGKGVLLGDAGYPCRNFLITPYHQPATSAQEALKKAHKKTRCTIERTCGILKRRFHILHSEIRLTPSRVCSVIGACAVLHNIAYLMKEPVLEGDGGGADPSLHTPFIEHEDGKGMRDYITAKYFS